MTIYLDIHHLDRFGWMRCYRRCNRDPGRRLKPDPPLGWPSGNWRGPDGWRGGGIGDPGIASARQGDTSDHAGDGELAKTRFGAICQTNRQSAPSRNSLLSSTMQRFVGKRGGAQVHHPRRSGN